MEGFEFASGSKDSQYKLESALELANSKSSSSRDNFDKELIKIDERLNISYSLFIGDFLRVFPLKNDPNNKWLNINEALSDELEQSNEINILTRNYYFSLLEGAKTDDWSKANIALQNIKDYQANMSSIIPSKFKIKSELFFNKFNIFERLTPFYLILGFSLLILVFINIFKPNLRMEKIIKITLVLIIFGFALHTLGLALRWYISGHAPWSNGYESMIYIAWAITLSGIIFSKQSHLALATTSILTGITLFVAHLSWLDAYIGELGHLNRKHLDSLFKNIF